MGTSPTRKQLLAWSLREAKKWLAQEEKRGGRIHSRSDFYDRCDIAGWVSAGVDIQRHWTVESGSDFYYLSDGSKAPLLETLHIRFYRASNGEVAMHKEVTYSHG